MSLLKIGLAAVLGVGCVLNSIQSVIAAEAYPSKVVRMMVGFSAGGGSDLLARLMAAKLSERLGQTFIVENKVGASGNIAGQQVAAAKPDGYTLLWIPIAHAVNAALDRELPYDPIGAFAPVTLVASNPTLLNVGPKVPVSNVKELLELARSQPGKVTFATSGVGTSSHIAAELFAMMAGVRMLHVPYKGGGEVTRSVLSGEVMLSFNDIQASIPLVRSNKVKAIATTGSSRAKILPDVPTVSESGVPGYQYAVWYGLLAPRNTPSPVVSKLRNEIVAIMKQPDIARKFESEGAELIGSSPEEFGQFLAAEVDKWRKVAKAVGIEP